MLQTPLTIQRLYDDNRESLELGWFAGFPGGERLISGDVASAADQVGAQPQGELQHARDYTVGPHGPTRAIPTRTIPPMARLMAD